MNSRQHKKKLVERLCKHLGLTLAVARKGRRLDIMIWPASLGDTRRTSDIAVYKSWQEVLFGSEDIYGLNKVPDASYNAAWQVCDKKAFNFSSLEELALKLDVLGA